MHNGKSGTSAFRNEEEVILNNSKPEVAGRIKWWMSAYMIWCRDSVSSYPGRSAPVH